MDLNKYTEKAQQAVLAAQRLAQEMNHPQIEPEHLDDEDVKLMAINGLMNSDPERAITIVRCCCRTPSGSGLPLLPSPRLLV